MRATVLGGCVEAFLDEAKLAIAPHKRWLDSEDPGGAADQAHDAQRTPELDRLGLALELACARARIRDGSVRCTLRRGADEDGSGICDRLDAARCVDEIACNHALTLRPERYGRLTREHADTGAQRGRADIGAERGNGIHELECGADGPLGIVLLCHGRTPDSHHGVADELLDRAAVALDHLAGRLEVPREQLARILGVACLGRGREADEVGKENRHEAPFCLWPRCLLGRFCARHERRSAFSAELRSSCIRSAARDAADGQRRTALPTEFPAGLVFGTASGADHETTVVEARSRYEGVCTLTPREPRAAVVATCSRRTRAAATRLPRVACRRR